MFSVPIPPKLYRWRRSPCAWARPRPTSMPRWRYTQLPGKNSSPCVTNGSHWLLSELVHQGRSQAETIANLQEITSQKCQRLLVASLFKFAIRVRVLPFCKENGQMSSLLKRRLLSLLLLLLGSG